MIKRKTSSNPSKIYTFGLRLPTEGSDLVVEQLRLTEGYRNALLVIELRRRMKVREAMSSAAGVAESLSKVAGLNSQIAEERASINAAKAAARSNKVDISAQRSRLKLLFAELRIARTALKSAKDACKTPEMPTSGSKRGRLMMTVRIRVGSRKPMLPSGWLTRIAASTGDHT